MTPNDQAKVLALLDKIDPMKSGPQDMKRYAEEVRDLLQKGGFEPQTVDVDVLESLRTEIKTLNLKVDQLLDESKPPKRARRDVETE